MLWDDLISVLVSGIFHWVPLTIKKIYRRDLVLFSKEIHMSLGILDNVRYWYKRIRKELKIDFFEGEEIFNPDRDLYSNKKRIT